MKLMIMVDRSQFCPWSTEDENMCYKSLKLSEHHLVKLSHHAAVYSTHMLER